MNLVLSRDQMLAVDLDSGMRLKAAPLSRHPDGTPDWSAYPLAPGSMCLGCPFSLGRSSACAYYNSGRTFCGQKQRNDNWPIVWRKA